MSTPALELDRINRILIIKLSSIGDVVHTFPMLTALRRRFSKASIAWLVQSASAELVSGHQALDATYVLGNYRTNILPEAGTQWFQSGRQLARRLRAEQFDLSLDVQGLFRSSIYGWLSRARWRVGFRNRQELAFLFNNLSVIPDRRDCHALEGYLEFARFFDAPIEPLAFDLPIRHEDREWATEFLRSHELAESAPLIALMPGTRWDTKRWPADRFATVAAMLSQQYGVPFVITGGPADQTLAQAIQALAEGTQIVDATGQTSLRQLAALLERCRLAITNDSGPMHIAAALGVPVVAIFGPTSPLRVGPYGAGHRVIQASLSCVGCYRRKCSSLECLRRVTPAEVAQAAGDLIGQAVPCRP